MDVISWEQPNFQEFSEFPFYGIVHFLLNWAKLAALIKRKQRHRLWWGLVGVNVEQGAKGMGCGQGGLSMSGKSSDRWRTQVRAVSCSGRDSKAHIIFPVFAKVFQG